MLIRWLYAIVLQDHGSRYNVEHLKVRSGAMWKGVEVECCYELRPIVYFEAEPANRPH